jgi:hypothetical protein
MESERKEQKRKTVVQARDADRHHTLADIDSMVQERAVNGSHEISIEAAQKNASHEDSHVSLAKALDKSSALQSHIASSNDAGLAWGLCLHKEIVRGDCQLSTLAFQRSGTASHCHHDPGTSDGLRMNGETGREVERIKRMDLGSLLIGHLQSVRIHELCEFVEVRNPLLSELSGDQRREDRRRMRVRPRHGIRSSVP